jgi:uncharacterized damage-inducible protein DinB
LPLEDSIMRRTLALFAVVAVSAAAPLAAQGPAMGHGVSAVAALARSFGQVSDYVTRSAEEMPEADFAFKPTPEVRSFGEILGHVASSNYMFCSQALGEKNPSGDIEKTKTTKAELVEAVRASFTYCERAYQMSDAEAAKTTTIFGRERPRLSALTGNLTHDWEHYGNLVTYLRLKGHVPPSSQRGMK